MAVPDVMLSPAVYNPLGPFIAVNESDSEGTGTGLEKGKVEKVERSVVTEDDGTSSVTTAGGAEKEKEKEKEGDKRSTRIRVSTFPSQIKDKERSLLRQQPVALESALLKVAAAREIAFLQRQKQEVCTYIQRKMSVHIL